MALFNHLASIRNSPIGLITPLCTRLSNGFALLSKFSLIFMNMQMRLFYIGPLDEILCQILSLMI